MVIPGYDIIFKNYVKIPTRPIF